MCFLPNSLRCATCIECHRGVKDAPPCYHENVSDEQTVEQYQNELELLKEDHKYLRLSKKEQEKIPVKYISTSTADGELLMTNINYQPVNEKTRHAFSTRYIDKSLKMLGLSFQGLLEERRTRLRVALELIERCELIQTAISNGDYSAASVLIDKAIPCIMHLENRCSEKMLKLLLVEGWDSCDGDTSRQSTFISSITDTVNSHILGTPERKSNWSMTTVKNSKGTTIIGDQTMYNYQVRKFLREESFTRLIDICVDDGQRSDKWKTVLRYWNLMMEILRHHEDFSIDEINTYQHVADIFFREWLDLHQKDGLTNYFHMIGAGHLSYYLKRWKNLYRYSQQGWEALNKYIKLYFFNRTQMGGYGGKKNEQNSHIDPIARWLQQQLIFMCWDEHENQIPNKLRGGP